MVFMKKCAILMGSENDWPVVKKCADTLKALEVPVEAHVYSAHRTPDLVKAFVSSAEDNGFGVIVAAAGKAAHLAGAVAAQTTLPVIGLPITATQLDGLDALLSTVQMPAGIPVATVAIGGAENAGLLAAQILAVGDEALAGRVKAQRQAMRDAAAKKDEEFQKTL
ncbi:MAG: 5-(carboxyamino)imidazole ribonucleotide mutase [Oscillospiraceae bacterium]|nr:5-(carboxyamino)imidazole ribonucleotide mutase [Oscillospiraceae bacterium]